MKRFQLFLHTGILGILITFVSCEDCLNCDGFVGEPSIQVRLLDGSGIQEATGQIRTLSDSLERNETEINDLSDTLTFMREELEIVEDSIANGWPWEDQRDSLQNRITQDSTSLVELELINEEINEALSRTDSTLQVLESGELILDSVINVLNSHFLDDFPDTVQSVSVPLNYNDEFSHFQFNFQGIHRRLELSHTNDAEVDINGDVIITISNLSVSTYSFDSAEIECITSNCLPDETSITCYY